MTSDAISRWLAAPAALPDGADIDAMIRAWPWFTPARLMDAMREHQQTPFSEKALAALQLHNSDWLPAYSILTQEDAPEAYDLPDDEVKEKDLESYELPEEDITELDAVEEVEAAEASEQDALPELEVTETPKSHPEPPLIQPLYTEDYFRHQGVEVADELPEEPKQVHEAPEEPQTLMVMLSFAEWLTHFKTRSQKEEEEAQEKRALRSMWQQEKLAAALDDEPDEIPEDVFEMAVSSITKEDDIISEPLAQIYERQEKWSAAADMYEKLARKYPAKSTYFAARADAARKRLL